MIISLSTLLATLFLNAPVHAGAITKFLREVGCSTGLIRPPEIPAEEMSRIVPKADPEFLRQFRWTKETSWQTLQFRGAPHDVALGKILHVTFDRLNFDIQKIGVSNESLEIRLTLANPSEVRRLHGRLSPLVPEIVQPVLERHPFHVWIAGDTPGLPPNEMILDFAQYPSGHDNAIAFVNQFARAVRDGEDPFTRVEPIVRSLIGR